MNPTTLRLLVFIVIFLGAAWLLVEWSDDSGVPDSGQALFPGLTGALNDVDMVTIERAGEETVEVRREGDHWIIAGRLGYPARVADVRSVLLAMADAIVVEPKTANPARHGQLGVTAPEAPNSKGIRVTAATSEQTFSVIFGNTAQGSYRYARINEEDQSWLIDQNPEIPQSVGEWLEADIVDIPSTRVQSATITHPDGEVVAVARESEEQTDFTVTDVPTDRELSYPTVANGIAGALNDLDLDDVRVETSASADVIVTEFRTFDGLVITASTDRVDGENWLSLVAEAADGDAGAADDINAVTMGWQFRIADYKANLLTRRWEDILAPVETPENE